MLLPWLRISFNGKTPVFMKTEVNMAKSKQVPKAAQDSEDRGNRKLKRGGF